MSKLLIFTPRFVASLWGECAGWVLGSGSVKCQAWRTQVVGARQPSRITLEVMIYNKMCRCDSFDFWVKCRIFAQKNTIKQIMSVKNNGCLQTADKQKQQTKNHKPMDLYGTWRIHWILQSKKSHIFSSMDPIFSAERPKIQAVPFVALCWFH